MKCCFCVPFSLIDRIKPIATAEFRSIEFDYLGYNDFRETPELIASRQSEFDLIIFGGSVPLKYCENELTKQTVWTCLPKNAYNFVCSLLQASLEGHDIKRLSIDTYPRELIISAYQEIGLDLEQTDSQLLTFGAVDQYVNENALSFHLNNIHNGKSTACITALVSVHERLAQLKIPHVLVGPTSNIIREGIFQALEVHKALQQCDTPLAALYIHIDLDAMPGPNAEDECHLALERNKITPLVYRMAQQINASVSETSLHQYFLTTTADILEAHTQYYIRLDLLSWLEESTCLPVSIGIGCGNSMAVAQKHAFQAVKEARKTSLTCAFAITENGVCLGPITQKVSNRKSEVMGFMEKLHRISERADISFNLAYKLYSYVMQSHDSAVSVNSLAAGLGLGRRSVNNLVNKLESAGIACHVGSMILKDKGRPSRLYKINL